MPTPPVVVDKEPPITEVRQAFDSLYIGNQYITARTANMDVRFSCELRVSDYRFKLESIREAGFCLSTTDSILSITNPAHIRLKATLDTKTALFTAMSSSLLPNQYYYLEPYFMTTDGRVYYGRYLQVSRLQTPSWQPRPAFNSVTRFKVSQLDRSIYKPITVVQRATLPPVSKTYNYYLFVCNDRLHVLDRDGSLFQYDASQDKWVDRKKLTVEPEGAFNGYPAIVFGLNNRGYVLYTHVLAPNPTYYWEYEPERDQWIKLDGVNKSYVAPYKYAYQAGSQAVLVDTYGRKVGSFTASQKEIQPVDRPSLLTYLSAGATIVTAGDQPYAIRTNYNTQEVTIGAYNADNDSFTDIAILSAAPTDRGSTLRFAQGSDVMAGLGYTTDLLGDSRITSYLTQYSDDLVRYDPQRKQTTARYDIAGVRSDGSYNYQTFTIGQKTYVIVVATGKMWELQF